MAADYPPIDRSYVVSYAANDRDYPVIGIKRDPRTAGYKVPEDLSPHPDSKRYPNHVFTGAQPSAGDQIVTHIYEILPAPWVPFTRYDDDLGPVQGRRRAVKNEGQQADLAADKKVSYEGRDGSAIVSNEIEETWSIKTDDDGNSLFPIRDRDFYDASRGAVQERRQLFVPTGEENGTLENINGVITQTSYEPYNEFLSVKVVQTYKVDGPQLIGQATDNDGQLITVTTQRKGALDYIPPSPTATRTVEVNREDAESLVERIVDTPEIFTAKTFSVERPDPIPQKFRVAVPTKTTQLTEEGEAEMPSISGNQIAKSVQQITRFTRRTSTTQRDNVTSQVLEGEVYTSELGGGIATVTESYGSDPVIDPKLGTISATKENLGNDQFVTTQIDLETPLPILKGQDYEDAFDVAIPYTRQFVEAGTELPLSPANIDPRDTLHSVVTEFDATEARERLLSVFYATGEIQNISLPNVLTAAKLYIDYDGATSGDRGVSAGNSARASASVNVSANADLIYDISDGYSGPCDATRYLFFLPKEQCSVGDILNKLTGVQKWPILRPKSERILLQFSSSSERGDISVGLPNNISRGIAVSKSLQTKIFNIPPTLHETINVQTVTRGTSTLEATAVVESPNLGSQDLAVSAEATVGEYYGSLNATTPPSFPAGTYLYGVNVSPYRFGLVRVEAIAVDITEAMV
jgi:hypothetical protein